MKRNFLSVKIKTLTVIAPDVALLDKIVEAFRLIRTVDPSEYQKIFDRLQVIFITHKTGGTNEFFMPEKIWFANKSVIMKNDLPWLASLIIHEAFHATQFKNGEYILPFGKELEEPAIALQTRFLKKLEGRRGSASPASAYGRKYWKAMDEDASSFACFRNLLELFDTKKLDISVMKRGKEDR